MTQIDPFPGRFDGRTIIVSGGARGMGEAHVRRLAAEGAAIVFTDLDDEVGDALAAELGEKVRYVHADVTSAEDWERTVAVARDTYGRVDGLINNAAVLESGTLETTSLEQYRRIVEILQVGVFLGMKIMVPAIKDAGGGSIVNVSATGGLVGFQDIFAYLSAKFAVTGMTKAAALELAGYGIRVNSIHPGEIYTRMVSQWQGTAVIPSFDKIPLDRFGKPEEVAALAAFLLSDEAGYITGSENVIDGGYTAQ